MQRTLAVVLLSGAAATLVAGCVTNVTNAQLAAVSPARPVSPAPTIVARPPAILTKTVAAGSTGTLEFLSTVNPDCSPRPLPTVRILQQPVHGTSVTEPREDYPNFPPANVRSACNKTRVAGLALTYKPEQSFTGSDYVEYEIIGDMGLDATIKVAITVK